MTSPKDKLEHELTSFRRDQAYAYLQRLSGVKPAEIRGQRSRALLTHEAGLELIARAVASGELPPHEYAAVCAHVARAFAEVAYAGARTSTLALTSQQVDVEGDTRSLGGLLGEWLGEGRAARRERLSSAADGLLGQYAEQLVAARARADRAAGEALSRLAAPRHPDAGPEKGVTGLAEQWLELSKDVASEAYARARAETQAQGEGGLDTLWATLGTPMRGLFRDEGRYRRLADELAPLGLRQQLAQSARLAPPHPGPFPAPHVLVAAAPRDVRLSPSSIDVGLASELLGADALGRAMAHVHASPALPFALRHASAATISRAAGAICTLRFTETSFLRKRRGLSIREAGAVARIAGAFVLLESRLGAAALLARSLSGNHLQARAQVLCERALLGPVPPGCSLFLLTRLSASSAFRGKVWAPSLVYALRERFDVDWYENPRAAEPLRGAFARAGDFSVEGLVEELGARIERGAEKLSELF